MSTGCGSAWNVRQVVEELRRRFQECLRANAPLSTWRELQLEILEVAKQLHRRTLEAELATGAEGSGESRSGLWAKLGDAFWIERDLTRLACMIEEVIAHLEGATNELDA